MLRENLNLPTPCPHLTSPHRNRKKNNIEDSYPTMWLELKPSWHHHPSACECFGTKRLACIVLYIYSYPLTPIH